MKLENHTQPHENHILYHILLSPVLPQKPHKTERAVILRKKERKCMFLYIVFIPLALTRNVWFLWYSRLKKCGSTCGSHVVFTPEKMWFSRLKKHRKTNRAKSTDK